MGLKYPDIALADLEPQFLKIIDERCFRTDIENIAEAEGVGFLCPKCYQINGGPVGTHAVICWSPKVPQSIPPVPGRWNLQGTGLHDLTLVAGSSSILITGHAHFWIRGGRAVEITDA